MQLKQIHRWLGLCLVAVMLVISLTGTVLLWKREYLWITIPDARQLLELGPTAISDAVLVMQDFYSDHELSFVQLGSENLSLHRGYLSNKRYAWHNQKGTQLEVWQGNDRFEDWLLELHHRFLLGNTIGLNIAGFGGLLLLLLMFIGFWLWWPRRQFFKLGLVPRSNDRGAWMRSHANLGALSLIPVMVLSISGVILVYPTESKRVLVDGFQAPAVSVKEQIELPQQPTLFAALELVEQQFPSSRPRWISLPSAERKSFVIGLQVQGAWNRMGNTSMTFYPDGRLTITRAELQSSLKRGFDFSYPLHTGKFDWYWRLLISIIGLSLSALCVYALRSYLKRS
ncbi:MAG: putative iron-regulated membrane protein [Cryomorphaceae bacterium]|jgi:uncharacterized iron-regulated membrane protein